MTNGDGKVDYSGCSDKELREVLSVIDRKTYPRNYENLVAEFERRQANSPEPQASNSDEAPHPAETHSNRADSPIAARVAGFATFVAGIASFLFRYEDGVFHARRGHELTFAEDPYALSIVVLAHAAIALIGLLGMIFGSRFYSYIRSD